VKNLICYDSYSEIRESYYENYRLECDIYLFELTERDKIILDMAIWCIDNKSSVRDLAKEFIYSKSHIHRLLTQNLRVLSGELWYCVKKVFILHKN